MLGVLKRIWAGAEGRPAEGNTRVETEAPTEIVLRTGQSFAFTDHIRSHYDFPIVDWEAVNSWVDTLDMPERGEAWLLCERAWLLHFRDALGPAFALFESPHSMVLSSLEENLAEAALDYIDRTQRRIQIVLAGIASAEGFGKEILIVLDDEESYYRYVSHAYGEASGEFAFSGGMHINNGCGHYIGVKADNLRAIEPVIAHELTHGSVDHLPLPLWLNEGLAVNTERRLTDAAPPLYTPQQMHEKHIAFWNEDTIQEFWSGKSFSRPDEGNMLSYDLARLLVEILSKDWERFRIFALAANHDDAGAEAAAECFSIELGETVCALFECASAQNWTPEPNRWPREPA